MTAETYLQAGYDCSLLAETGVGTSHTQDMADNLLQNCVMQSSVHGILLISGVSLFDELVRELVALGVGIFNLGCAAP